MHLGKILDRYWSIEIPCTKLKFSFYMAFLWLLFKMNCKKPMIYVFNWRFALKSKYGALIYHQIYQSKRFILKKFWHARKKRLVNLCSGEIHSKFITPGTGPININLFLFFKPVQLLEDSILFHPQKRLTVRKGLIFWKISCQKLWVYFKNLLNFADFYVVYK